MSDYDDVVESALLEEEQAVVQAEKEGSATEKGRFSVFISCYISAISFVVAVAALLTAFAADDWMEDTLAELADTVDINALRLETQCQEIQRELAVLNGRPPEGPRQIRHTARELTRVERKDSKLRHEAAVFDKAHYVLAMAITLLQIATALAIVMSITKRRQLLYVSGFFAGAGLLLVIVGTVSFLT